MLLIAHRGLLNGPDKELENNPKVIIEALAAGYDAEIDLQVVNNELFLGHDEPTYKVNEEFLIQRGLWIHAKNVEALRYLTTTNTNYFYHEEDPMVITTHSWVWVHPKHLEGNLSMHRTIAVVPEYVMPISDIRNLKVTGVCSDYGNQLK